jgi:hydroxymethylpyrimidine/phosphomethylpyrimidine kinase
LKIALSVAGSDSGGGAGIAADLHTFAALGVHGACAITAVTAQDTTGVHAVFPLPPEIVARQIEVVAADMDVAAVKTGMLGTLEIAAAVARTLRARGLRNVVVDPVLAATGGGALLAGDGAAIYRKHLVPLATLLTPNLGEAEALLGARVRTLGEMREAARALVELGAAAALVKGGHLEGDPVDVLFDGRTHHELRGPRVPTPHTHGTGCTLSAAAAAYLALGVALLEAVTAAKAYVTEALRHGYPVGRGPGVLDHQHPRRS